MTPLPSPSSQPVDSPITIQGDAKSTKPRMPEEALPKYFLNSKIEEETIKEEDTHQISASLFEEP